MTIGRTPDADVFLDDVTVSRDHAVARAPPGRLAPRRLRVAERHLRQPRAGSTRTSSRTATRSRSASTSSTYLAVADGRAGPRPEAAGARADA